MFIKYNQLSSKHIYINNGLKSVYTLKWRKYKYLC